MENKAYITLLIGDELLGNVLVLYSSLRAHGAKYPFKVATTIKDGKISLSLDTMQVLERLGIEIILLPSKFTTMVAQAYPHLARWEKAIDKLQIFGLRGYDRLVYLDADLWIWGNLDYLFDKPQMYCPFTAEHDGLCSALMVYTPSDEMYATIVNKYNELTEQGCPVHDQLVLQQVYNKWLDDESLHMCYPEFTYYYEFERGEEYDKLFYDNTENLKAIHFGGEKPNTFSQWAIIDEAIKTNCGNSGLLLAMYRNYWNSVVKELKGMGIETPYMKLLYIGGWQ